MAPRTELLASWAVTLRHLAACRFYLPEILSAEACEIERQWAHFLHHNELGLALGEAEALGECCSAPAEFWRELRLAAASMRLAAKEADYAARSES